MELVDGRELAWIEYGVQEGAPPFGFHGSPGTCHHFAGLAEVAARKGVRLIAPDRPGYGHSTYHPARSYESWARDVGQLADHLGIDRFAVFVIPAVDRTLQGVHGSLVIGSSAVPS
jgi:pimeloyl-ACP methyl ester carboxylesterase